MDFATWDTLFNLLLLVFWFRIWSPSDRDVHFNPYLSPVGQLGAKSIEFLRPVFFGFPSRWIAAAALVFLVALRGIAAPTASNAWVLRFGFEVQQCGSGVGACILFSALSFGVFLFKLWGFSLVYARQNPSTLGNTGGAIHHLSRPFTTSRVEYRPIILIGFGLVLAFALNMAGAPASAGMPFALRSSAGDGTLPSLLLHYGISSLAAWVDVLLIIRILLILLIIGSWISMFASSHGIMMFCRDWMDMLLGPMRRFPIRIGMFDLTPLVFLLAIQMLIYPILMGVLLSSYGRLP